MTLPTQGPYERVLDEMATLRLRKVLAYGEGRYHETDAGMAYLLLYADLHRKYQRLETWFEGLRHGTPTEMPAETIRDTLLDLGNYAVMGVQLLDQFTLAREPPAL